MLDSIRSRLDDKLKLYDDLGLVVCHWHAIIPFPHAIIPFPHAIIPFPHANATPMVYALQLR